MRNSLLIGALALAALLGAGGGALADEKYPDWKGQWVRIGGGAFDPTKPNGRGQQPPLTEEYRAIWETNLAIAEAGGQEYNPQARCMRGGMPRMMIGFEPIELIVRPEVTYIYLNYINDFRRVYTDGRNLPKQVSPTFTGYSIGQWIDENGDGRYDTLVIETRGFRGPRHFEASGIPTHNDNQTVIKERIRLDPANENILIDEITAFDNALTRPWTVTRKFRRERNAVWIEHNCGESQLVHIGNESYFRSAEGHLMPTKKGQAPPALRGFNKTGN